MHATPDITTAGERLNHIPDVIPIFPLPKVVMLPGEVLPLHIFEERYREMVSDSLTTNRLIGMVEVKPGFEEQHLGGPPILPVGCVGLIGQCKRLDDGRFLMWLFGLQRFEIDEEVAAGTSYRQARVTYTGNDQEGRADSGLHALRRELCELLPGIIHEGVDNRSSLENQLEEISDSQLIALASQVLQLPSTRKRQILESASAGERFFLIFEDLYAHLENHPEVAGHTELGELN